MHKEYLLSTYLIKQLKKSGIALKLREFFLWIFSGIYLKRVDIYQINNN